MRAPQKSLKKWGDQKWRTKSGKPSTQGPMLLVNATSLLRLSSLLAAVSMPLQPELNEKARRRKQHVSQPKKVADKTRRFRANKGGVAKSSRQQAAIAVSMKKRGLNRKGSNAVSYYSIPYFKAWVRREYTKNLEEYHGEFLHCMVIGVTTMPNRTLSFQVLFTGCESDLDDSENVHGGACGEDAPDCTCS